MTQTAPGAMSAVPSAAHGPRPGSIAPGPAGAVSSLAQPALAARLPWWLLAVLYVLSAAALAWIHPYPWRIGIVAALFAAACALRARVALIALPAMMPCISLVAWTGAFYADEFDVLWLAGLAGASVSLASGGVSARLRGATQWFVFLIAFALAVVHGVAACTGYLAGAATTPAPLAPVFYFTPENALRIAKGYAWAFAALPVLHGELRRAPEAASRALALGLAGAAAVVALAATWERFAFTGLADLTSDYRSTGLFWEMHVGGAALDACIALTLPFTVWACVSARSRVTNAVAVLLLLVGMLFVAAFTRAATRGARGSARAACVAIALAGIALIGVFDSVFDVPRVTTLCYLVMFWALLERRIDAGMIRMGDADVA